MLRPNAAIGSVRGRLLLGGGLALLLVGHAHFANITVDDAFISFRYAENLATGHGLVFNLGERVEGYSNFLWTVLLAIPFCLHVDRYELGLLVTAKVMGVLLSVGTALIVTRAASLERTAEQRAMAPIAALYLATLAPFSMWGVGALETPLVTLLVSLTAYLHLREDAALRAGSPGVAWSQLSLLLAALTRPEPVLLFVPLAMASLLRSHRFGGRAGFIRAFRQLGFFVVPYAAFLALRYEYYGQLVPNTYFAKLASDGGAAVRGSRYIEQASEHLHWSGLALVCGALILLARRLDYRLAVVLLLTVLQIAVVQYEGGDWMPGCRLLVPVLPLTALFVSEAWLSIGLISRSHLAPAGRVPSWLVRPGWLSSWQRLIENPSRAAWNARLGRTVRVTAYITLFSVCVASGVGSFDTVAMKTELSGLRGLRLSHSRYFEVARWMRRELHEPGLLALGEAGIVPYYTKLPILDLHGLMDPYIASLRGGLHRKYDGDYVFRRKPKYLFLPINRAPDGKLTSQHFYASALLGDRRFSDAYEPLKDFGFAILYARKPR